MRTEELYADVRQVVRDYTQAATSRALAAQQLLDLLHRIDRAAKAGELTKSDKNRHVVLVLQHLSLILRSPGPGSFRNALLRGNLLLHAAPVLVITGLDFSGLSLPNFDLSRAMLIACNFDEADLRGARMTFSQLQGCSFRRTDLSNSNFQRSTFYGCGFEDANTRNAKGLG